ncbi:MAG: type IVB secretion system protein IcmH/DotU, partial [Defluviicoccus sp.]
SLLTPAPAGSGEPLPEGTGNNPLLRAAAPLVALVRQLRETRRHDDVPGLRRDVIEAIRRFDAQARAAGVEPKMAAQASYALCALIDETVLSTPWGLDSLWSKQGLLITFYKEQSAGETFFRFLKEAREFPRNSGDLLEVLYVCMSLGFQGRYRMQEDGLNRLGRIREETFALIRQQRGDTGQELSPQWRGVEDRRPAVSRFVPFWVIGAAAAALVLIAYFGFSVRLNEASDLVYTKIGSLVPPAPIDVIPPTTGPATLVMKLKAHLAAEIGRGIVSVRDRGTAADIVFASQGLFPSGGAEVGPDVRPVLAKIGTFLAGYTMPVTVSGHTDPIPIRTARFPSNFHLSKARAEAVAAVLGPSLGSAGRLRTEGRADSVPIADNATEQGRALNRRVEIHIPVTRTN